MTQNEAKEYVANKDNWAVVGVTQYARVRKLTYGSLSYLMVETKRVVNDIERYMHKEIPVVLGYTASVHYIHDTENDCMGYTISESQIAREVWKESKK